MPKLKKPDIILLVVFLVINGLLSFYFVKLHENLQLLTKQEEQKGPELKLLKKKIKKLPQIKEELALLKKEEAKLQEFIPNEEGQTAFIWQLEELAKKNNIELLNCGIKKGVKTYKIYPDYLIYQWELSFNSNYQELMSLLRDIPESDRSALIAQLQINSLPIIKEAEQAKSKGDKYRLNVTMHLDLIARPTKVKVAAK